ncbi:phosphate transport system substrate-binding protein [Amphibacillus marinus]|uniref:Phosphate transport system substrate-binding protein n=1 Tax=Amphibacillus marinus TaxID=872970 RepID=A0A1H8SLH3_9BACI|nr:substrate-binding domain-containing protein [Amphibacillus marinus]SEO79532.1 phosphate transport system substrate-binding protein [Amphibacillus marinus]
MNNFQRFTVIFSAAILIGFVAFVASLVTLFMGGHPRIPVLIAATAIMVWLIIVIDVYDIFSKSVRTKLKLICGGLWLVVVIGFSGFLIYQNSLATLDGEEPEMWRYTPFDNDGTLASLDQPATLQLTDDLPRLDGATGLYPLYAAFAQATYPEGSYESYDSEVMLTTTPEAYQNLLDGAVDVIFAAGPSKNQLQLAETKGLSFNLTPIGREAFVFFVNKRNPIDELSIKDIKGIYSGDITNWSELGGRSTRIRAFQRPEDSGSQTALQNLMDNTPIMEAPSEDIIDGMGGILNQTANYRNYRNAIGYSFRFFAMDMIADNDIKFLTIDAAYPSIEAIQDGTYPLSSEFYAITVDDTNENVQALIDWILSEQGQQLVAETGFVPLSDPN